MNIIHAAHAAADWHHGQMRKSPASGPYIDHPARVAARITRHPEASVPLVCAAWLHDVIEDCGVTEAHIWRLFGPVVASLVVQLTNPSKQRPDLPRSERRRMDREHAAGISIGAKLIKLADRADNLHEVERGSDFAKLYASESALLLYALRCTDAQLEGELAAAIEWARGA